MTDKAKPESVKLDEFKQMFMNKTKTENDSKLKLKKDKRAIAPLPPLTKRKPTRIMGEEVKGYKRGGGVCIRGMNKDAYGKNS